MEKVRTFWDRYAVQIITVIVIAVGFYFTTNAKLAQLENHEVRLKTVEIEIAMNNVILERLEKQINAMDRKLDRLIESRGIK